MIRCIVSISAALQWLGFPAPLARAQLPHPWQPPQPRMVLNYGKAVSKERAASKPPVGRHGSAHGEPGRTVE
eukprot:9331351-Lingulodinium_polyedra.AAC.1